IPPEELLRLAVLAEECGFDAIHSSDHFHPWSEKQGHSGYSFAWLGAAMQVTRVDFGLICAPGYRYHPAVIAQAAATLARMFPGRLTLSLGSGEALNEHITGEPWPTKPERNARLSECANVIARLLDGENVTYRGRVTVEDAKIYSRPLKPVPLFAAALSPETAAEVAPWADGLLTVYGPELTSVIDAFRQGGGEHKPLHVKVDVCYGRNLDAAQRAAWEQWRTNVLGREHLANVRSPAACEALADTITPEGVAEKVLVANDPEPFLRVIEHASSLGVASIILHHVGRDQETFIRDCAPALCK